MGLFNKEARSRSLHGYFFWLYNGLVMVCKTFVLMSDEKGSFLLLMICRLQVSHLLVPTVSLCCGCSSDGLLLLMALRSAMFARAEAGTIRQQMISWLESWQGSYKRFVNVGKVEEELDLCEVLAECSGFFAVVITGCDRGRLRRFLERLLEDKELELITAAFCFTSSFLFRAVGDFWRLDPFSRPSLDGQ